MNPQISATSVGNTILAFVTFIPEPAELFAGEPSQRLRINETCAVAVSVGVGLMLSFAAGEPGPLLFSVITAAALVAGVEYLARSNTVAASAPENYSPDRMI